VTVLWDVGGDGTVEGEGPFFYTELPPGESFIEVRASDPSNNSCMKVVRVMVLPRQGEDARYYGLAIAAFIAIVVWCARKRVKRA
jgi:hypothetical protein